MWCLKCEILGDWLGSGQNGAEELNLHDFLEGQTEMLLVSGTKMRCQILDKSLSCRHVLPLRNHFIFHIKAKKSHRGTSNRCYIQCCYIQWQEVLRSPKVRFFIHKATSVTESELVRHDDAFLLLFCVMLLGIIQAVLSGIWSKWTERWMLSNISRLYDHLSVSLRKMAD